MKICYEHILSNFFSSNNFYFNLNYGVLTIGYEQKECWV